MSQAFDVVVIGSGPGGYTAAIRCAQLGFSTACVEKWADHANKVVFGGTCLNVGCIPSKALLESSAHYAQMTHDLACHGVQINGSVSLDVAKMMARRQKIVNDGTKGIQYLFRKNKITHFFGVSSFLPSQGGVHSVQVNQEVLSARFIIIATGSVPRTIPNVTIDNQIILDNAGALSLSSVPERLGIIGAGVIGIELGSVWRRLGSAVTLLEAAPVFLATADVAIAEEALAVLTKQGLEIRLDTAVQSVVRQGEVAEVTLRSGEKLTYDKLIVAVGRQPYTDGLQLSAVGLAVDKSGFIVVDDHCQTNVSGLFAIGDVVRGPMLAHKASEEGVLVAEILAGQKPHLDFNNVPWIVYTDPEIAWVGKTEVQCRAEQREIRVGQASFFGNGRAKCLERNAGFVKMIACAKTDQMLGVHMIGPWVSELIMQCVIAMEFQASSEDIARIIYAHPSLSEVVHEAALAVDQRSING